MNVPQMLNDFTYVQGGEDRLKISTENKKDNKKDKKKNQIELNIIVKSRI